METRIVIAYRELGVILRSTNNIDSLVSYVKTKFELNSDELEIISAKMKSFHQNFNKKLIKCSHSIQNLMRDPWMRGKIEVILKKKEDLKRKVGRPGKKYEECTARTKRRKIQELCASVPKDQIERAAVRCVKKPVAKMVRQIIQCTATESKELCSKITRKDVIPLSDTEAVSVLIELDLGKHQYISLRNLTKIRNADIFPPYDKVVEAKKLCYPDPSSIEVNENSGSIKLQALLDHTSKRLLQSFSVEDIVDLPTNIMLLSKYGCDGASGQSRYKQSLKSDTEKSADFSKVFMSSLVPLRMVDESNSKMIYWQNIHSGSPRYCRPIKFEFAGECKERTVEEMGIIKEQIKNLEKSVILIGEKRFFVSYKLFPSMIDGKTCAYLTNTDSSTTCPICNATPTEMNDVEKLSLKIIDESLYEFGLSLLHAKIRFMEFVLHLAYNLPFKKWTASAKSGNAELKKLNKQRIQNEFEKEMDLLMDVVKQGSGTTNDGNTARRFFADPETVARITEVDVNIITRLGIILQTLSCGRDIDAKKFGEYAIETYNLIVAGYNWYRAPWSVHRVLMHGEETIAHNMLPIGQLTEEAAEARNKDFRRFREYHTRKFNKKVCNEDLLHCLLVSSDPVISEMRPISKKKQLPLPPEVKALLLKDAYNNSGDCVEDTS